MTTSLPAGRDISPRHNLPAEVASFIGREREVAEIKRVLPRVRMLTLTGTGGCGKTRLALRAAADLAQTFPDGAWLVQLAPLSDSALVPRAVATVLGVHGTPGRPLLATLAAALASCHLLLVLDNCEHVVGACARLAETLLRSSPHLRILATSREPLRISGEVTRQVPPLALPAGGPTFSPVSLAQVESVALFLDRAQARQPDFALTPHNALVVAAICRHLEGLPLGIELAAARIGTLTPEQIANRLDDSLRLLGGGSRTVPRHETLRATLDWSYALLSDAESKLFRRLSVFAGGFSLEAAESICCGEGFERADILSLFATLVEKSLVETLLQPGVERYRLLEPIRQYGWARLTEHEQAEAIQRRYACYFLKLVKVAEPKLMSGERGPWLERLAMDEDNIRAALAWTRSRTDTEDVELGLYLTGALLWFWVFRGEVSEGLEWAEALLSRGHEAAHAARASALHTAGELAWLLGQSAQARTRLEESAALYRAIGDKRGLAYTLQVLPLLLDQPTAGAAATESLMLFEEVGDAWGAAHATMTLSMLSSGGDDGHVAQMGMEASLARWRAVGDEWGMAQALNILGDLARSQGNIADATAHYQESLALLRRQGMTGTIPSLLHNLGYLALRGDDARRALGLFRESLSLFRSQGDHRGIAECLAGLAGVLAALKQPQRAARLLGAAEAQFEVSGAATSRANLSDSARTLTMVRAGMDESALAAEWATGRALSLEQAITEALAAAPAGQLFDGAEGFDLTSRELEVAMLVAQGLTNRQIGATLVITEGTARLHVKHILRKLGFTSRAQIAGWVVARGLVAAEEPKPGPP